MGQPGITNQIPYEYRVKVTNRFKALDLVNGVCEELWTNVYNIVQGAENKAILKNRRKFWVNILGRRLAQTRKLLFLKQNFKN